MKYKFFMRYEYNFWNRFYLQTAFKGGLNQKYGGTTSSEMMKVNDQFYLHNFKGIKNLGYKAG